jgi:hypothetical protein
MKHIMKHGTREERLVYAAIASVLKDKTVIEAGHIANVIRHEVSLLCSNLLHCDDCDDVVLIAYEPEDEPADEPDPKPVTESGGQF